MWDERAESSRGYRPEAVTGRLTTAADPVIRRMLLDPPHDRRPQWKADCDRIAKVDQAHVVMLAERGIVSPAVARTLLVGIRELVEDDFEALAGIPRPRGLYLAYEGYLIERYGERVGGALHTGRSRNDLNATCLRLGLRDPVTGMLRRVIRLALTLLNRARRYRETVMPAYTHYQAAVPITYGHYLLGQATALSRETDALLAAAGGLTGCPLGAGAVGGTSIPIDPERTAGLLGFTAPMPNSVDAVASRDVVLRLLACAATLGALLDRAAVDLLLWSSAEFGFLHVPDGLVGSSSMMPQKRNPFVLEHVQGRSSAALGAFVAAVAATRGTPYTNSISAGTEAVGHVWDALGATTDAVVILTRVFSASTPCAAAMVGRAEEGLTVATAVAEGLVRRGVPFRRAHHEVGAAVRLVHERRVAHLDDALPASGQGVPGRALPSDPTAVCRAADFGGGPGPRSHARTVRLLCDRLAEQRDALREHQARWDGADQRLAAAVARVIDG